jgi:hypothetical protein
MKHTLATDATQCPCCGETTESSDQFYRHLAKHLEDIATLSLMPNLPCEFSTNIDEDLQLAETVPSHLDQEGSVQSTGPLQQHARERTDEHETQRTLRRVRSAPNRERGLGMYIQDVTPLGGTSDVPSSSHGFRRHSWDNLPNTTQSLAILLDSLESRRSEDYLDTGSKDSIVTGAHETTWMIGPSVPESSEASEDQYRIPKDDPATFEIDEELLRAIFSFEPGYQDLQISNDDTGLVCYINFESTISAFRAAYKLNHRPMSDSNTARLSIDFSGKVLSVRVAAGQDPGLPLSDVVEQYAHTPSIPFLPVSEQHQNHEQTDQSWWAIKPYTHGAA